MTAFSETSTPGLNVKPATGQPAANNHARKMIILIILLVIAGSAFGYYLYTRGRLVTDDAYIEGKIYSITPRVAGYVAEVLVDDNQEIKAGQALLKLDDTEYEVALAEARAALAEARATLTALEMGVPLELNTTGHRVAGASAALDSLRNSIARLRNEEQAAAEDVARAQAQSDQAALDLRRMSALLAKKVVAQSEFDAARTRADSASAQLGAAKAGQDAVRKQADALKAEARGLEANVRLAATGEDVAAIKTRQVEAQKARLELAQARLRQAELNLGYTTVLSPADGFVTKKSIQAGTMVSRGQPLMAVVPLDPRKLWVTANYKETQLTDVRPGQKVSIRVDTYPGMKIKGHVESIMAGTGAAFSLFPPENATGNYVKIVQRIPVRIALELDSGTPPDLRVGMSVIPTIFTD